MTGATLSGERAMTELYSVSIGTVRRAIVELRKRGPVATLPAKGTCVIAMPEPSGDTPEAGVGPFCVTGGSTCAAHG